MLDLWERTHFHCFKPLCYRKHRKLIQTKTFKACLCLIWVSLWGLQKPWTLPPGMRGPWKPSLPVMSTGDQSFICCFWPLALERVRKWWGIQSNVICHPESLDEKAPITGLLSKGKWKIIAGSNTKAPRNREALICETLASEKASGVKLPLWILSERSVCFIIEIWQKN